MASIKDVAREAGVSTATVSRMMANKGYLSEATRTKVQAAIDKLSYRPNRAAQQLRAPRSRILAFIVADIQNPFFGELCRSVERHARQRGYCVFVCNTDEQAEQERHYLELVAQERVAGVIISPSTQGAKHLQLLEKMKIPAVTVDRPASPDYDAVLIDNADAAKRLTDRVLDGGYRRVAGIFGAKSFTAEERLKGFESALSERGLTAHTIQRPPAFEAEGRTTMEQLLAQTEPPDAVVCSSALLATGAYRAIHEAGLAVPRQIGFACFDDPPWATFVTPALTVMRQPASMIGEAAFDLLMKRIEAPDRSPSLLRLQGNLVERGSLA